MDTPRRALAHRFIKDNAARLEARVGARFPGRRLAVTASEVSALVDETVAQIDRQLHRLRIVRWISIVVVVVILTAVVAAVAVLVHGARDGIGDATAWPPFFESVINDLVFAGIAIWFVWVLPQRLFRSATLDALHELRSMAHVIDMHQMTKDPERLRPGFIPTSESIAEDLTAGQLSNYLDYCSELLSCLGKLAALYGQHTTDSAVLAAVADVEDLTTAMSRKIWQKIALLPQYRVDRDMTS